jgi:hypothetical protein
MKFRFPIVIIDEDFRSENTSGLGIRALAQAIEGEGYEVMGVTSYGDLSQFAQQQSRASAFILSIDDEEFTPGPDLDPAVLNLRTSSMKCAVKIPMCLFMCTVRPKPQGIYPTIFCVSCMASFICLKTPQSLLRVTSFAKPKAIWKAFNHRFSKPCLTMPKTVPIHGIARTFWGRCVFEKSSGTNVSSILW